MSRPAVGFVGLGAMGFGMATHLVKEGYPVHGFDVFPASVERFKAAGGIPASSLKESAQGKHYYICMVASAPQVQSVLFGDDGIVSALPQDATLILCSTVPASYAQSVASELQSCGRGDIQFIDAPVSGGAKRAGDGTLSIMAGATDAALEKGKFLLETMSDANKLYLVPGGIGAGSNMKMVHQVLAGIHILGASEAMGFAAQLGLDAVKTAEAIKKSDSWTWMHENRLQRMLEEDWHPGASALTIILKDVGIITTSARENQFPTPLCSTAEQVYLSALLQEYGRMDDSSMVRQYYSQPITKVNSSKSDEESAAALQSVLDVMQLTNLVAAAEAIAFAKYLKVDLKQFYTLVSDAAGSSRQFMTLGLEMIEGKVGKNSESVDQAINRLRKAVQKARDLHCPLHLGNATMNVLLMAKRAGLGADGSTSVVKMFGF
ncbi:Hydroxy monocarboxylic acid anion dehydrogenase family protein [Penicillium ucsense]|uniref:Hydroxy monocarboxylic acid anion dehydrogenase family protein n=1 Tax=Penicillium ucsense TaxID=2839758 RepID=A0A8J8W857_9EURO|nr:Hydroxy monocarboxylic acid anion dehydrogenase family protein [Penicillium ucsense]KAF7736354.1 Hydroxy monocarboxylic acid anion dehydrogenase family protein [Penicillium ucsense]